MHQLFPYLFAALLSLPLQLVQPQRQEQVDSLRIALSKAKSPEKVASLNLTLYKKLRKQDSDLAQLHLDKALSLSNGTLSDSLYGRILLAQVEQHLIANNYDSVFHYANKVEDLRKHLDPKLLVDLYSMVGTAHYYKSGYAEAILAHRRAEKISDANNLEAGKAKVFNNIGITYIKMENWPEAKKYMTKSFDLCEKYGIKRGMAFTLGNLGIINKNQHDYYASIEAYEKSNVLLTELRDERGLARNYDNLGVLYQELGNYNKAFYYYDKSLSKANEINDESTATSALHNLAGLYMAKGEFASALANFKKSLAIAVKLDNKDVIRDNHLGLSQLYEQIGKPSLALLHQKSYTHWKDSIINQEHLKNISELEIKYESEKKEKEILFLSKQKLIADDKLSKQRTRIKRLSYSILGITLALSAGILLIIQYLKNRKQKELIETMVEAQMSERARIARDLHDSVGGSLAMTKNVLQEIGEKLREEHPSIQKSIRTISETSDQVRQISHNLMPGELVKFGLVTAINATLEHLPKTSLATQLYTFNMEERIHPTKEIHLFRIVQEAIQNVIKHAQASKLDISLNKHRKYLSLMVEDNGVGIDIDSLQAGIGLENIKSRVSQLKGTFNIDTNKGRGTAISIQIPI
ncbi:ATP-binding protein [Poritiphilus flavus]|uniref:Oxygen sensor histidine kinase NreB n=1 Tax=Poritiphilus flavus TaxID=2697053 RepID=A0A6L9ECF8_9FLAO|nr:tetratricopeptide repeat protein [Poritiphilus flavus]NAS12291.1 tetratricopeptide repeat protein [Poritiphilus flavus]